VLVLVPTEVYGGATLSCPNAASLTQFQNYANPYGEYIGYCQYNSLSAAHSVTVTITGG
jgi:hypothetical protein